MKIPSKRDQIVVERLDEPSFTKFNIVPDSAKDESTTAKVVAVGSGRLLENGRE